MTPYLFRIIKSDRKSWLKFLMCKKAPWSTFSISELVSGTSLTLNNTIRRELAELNIMGNSIQDGEPSPENPVPVNSVGNNVNEFDKDNANIMTANLSNYTKISNNSPSNKTLYMEIKPNTTYTISKVLSNYFTIGTTETEPQFAMDYQQNKYNANAKSLTITTSSTAKYLLVWYWNSADTLTEEEIRNSIKIEQGSIASPYSPYGMGCASIKKTNVDSTQSKTYIIPTRQPMRSIGETRDDFAEENERHKIARYVFTGDETISIHNQNTNRTNFKVDNFLDIEAYNNSRIIPNMMSNRFTAVTQEAVWVPGNISRRAETQTSIYISFEPNTTVAQFKAWLKAKYDEGNPVYVDYVLAEPLLLPCTAEQSAILDEITTDPLYAEQTNFFSNDEVPTYLEVKYWKENI